MRTFYPVILLFVLPACSSIVEGRSQQITVNTSPSGANCTLKRQDQVIGSIPSTPGTATIEKTKDDLTIACGKPGYETTTYLNHSGAAGATWGNIVAGGGIGWAVDSATGADNKYDSTVNMTLAKK